MGGRQGLYNSSADPEVHCTAMVLFAVPIALSGAFTNAFLPLCTCFKRCSASVLFPYVFVWMYCTIEEAWGLRKGLRPGPINRH